jgi:hypothetical protein
MLSGAGRALPDNDGIDNDLNEVKISNAEQGFPLRRARGIQKAITASR